MFKERKSLLSTFIIFTFTLLTVSCLSLLVITSAGAANWQPMPTYNVLWPLWSPALSPGGTPLVTDITRNTILPVQPGLAWDPAQALPWALYNTPTALGGGLLYFDQIYGLNTWPPKYMQDPATGAPVPITLPLTWSLLLPTSLAHLEYYIPLANATYALTYGITGPSFLSLLTPAQIWGLPPI
ncbi:MAG: hypothetical protein AB1611_19410 [bacterium]